ncbi:MAG: holo-ACP synthase [Treponema sp.]|nr:holo-ACP synthase [Treponema sp.]
MIYGIGTDIAQVSRFEKWARNEALLFRVFADAERCAVTSNIKAMSRHYAARFAAKEAFAKALGTGFIGLTLKDFWVVKDENGKPAFSFGASTKHMLAERVGSCVVHLSMSHEKEYATAFVVIEKEAGCDARKDS